MKVQLACDTVSLKLDEEFELFLSLREVYTLMLFCTKIGWRNDFRRT